MPNKTKVVVLAGVILLALSTFNLPVLTYFVSDSTGEHTAQIMGNINILPAVLILVLLLLRWKWRGILWIAASLAGALATPIYAQALFSITQSAGSSGNMYLSDPAFGIGLIAIVLSYLVILAGSLWDLSEQRHGIR